MNKTAEDLLHNLCAEMIRAASAMGRENAFNDDSSNLEDPAAWDKQNQLAEETAEATDHMLRAASDYDKETGNNTLGRISVIINLYERPAGHLIQYEARLQEELLK